MTATIDITTTTIPLAELAESWLIALEAEGRSLSTLKAYAAGVTGFTTWYASTYPDAVPVLDAASVRAYQVDLRRAGQKPGTVRLRYAALRRFSKWLTDEGELDCDPLLSMKPPQLGKPMVESVPEADLDALLKACKGNTFADRRDYALVMVLASTGMRAGEATALTVDDIDLRDRIINIRRGKGAKQRLVPLLPATAQAIDRYMRVRRGHRLAHTGVLWLGEQGRAFTYQGCARALGNRAKAAGLTGFHLHRLRHSFASRWLEAGGSETGLMAAAGWRDRSMIQRYTDDTASRRAMEEAKRLGLDKF